MPIEHRIYDTDTLLGVMADMPPVPSYWLDLLFPTVMTFTDEYIDFEKLSPARKLAPFVSPSAQGKPLFSEGSTVTRLKPAYVKPKDAVNPGRMLKRRPGELVALRPQSPQQRYNAIVADITREHRESIMRRWEWLAAQAAIYGTVTISGENYPERVVDFQRSAANTVALTGTSTWNGTEADILGNINAWRHQIRIAPFGGPTNRLTVGADAWDAMSKNPAVLKQLDTQMRGTNADLNTGVREGLSVEFVGRLSGTLDVYVYSDYYQQEDGSAVPFMSSKDVVLSGPNFNGVQCFGAILDAKAGFQALPVFPKMWDENDPPVTFVMTQSAPLMVPVNPNNTLRATVLT